MSPYARADTLRQRRSGRYASRYEQQKSVRGLGAVGWGGEPLGMRGWLRQPLYSGKQRGGERSRGGGARAGLEEGAAGNYVCHKTGRVGLLFLKTGKAHEQGDDAPHSILVCLQIESGRVESVGSGVEVLNRGFAFESEIGSAFARVEQPGDVINNRTRIAPAIAG